MITFIILSSLLVRLLLWILIVLKVFRPLNNLVLRLCKKLNQSKLAFSSGRKVFNSLFNNAMTFVIKFTYIPFEYLNFFFLSFAIMIDHLDNIFLLSFSGLFMKIKNICLKSLHQFIIIYLCTEKIKGGFKELIN